MPEEPTPIDISNMPELLCIVDDVRASKQPRMLRRDSEDVALVVPVAPKRRRAKAPAHYEAALETAGSWKDLADGKALKEQLDAERGSDRASASL